MRRILFAAVAVVGFTGLGTQALAAARVQRAIERKASKSAEARAEDRGDDLKVAELVDEHSGARGDLSAAETTLKSLGTTGRAKDTARVVSYVFGISEGRFAASKGHGSLSPEARKAIERLSPRDTAQRLRADGVSRDQAVVVLNRLERLKTDPSFLAGPDAATKMKSLMGDHDQKLSETQLAWNESVADEVYGAK